MDVKDYFSEEDKRKIETLSENDVAIFDNIESLPRDDSFHTDEYIALLCLNGKATCRVDDKMYEICKNDVFTCRPNQFVESAMTSIDFKSKAMIMSPAFLESIFIVGGNSMIAPLVLKECPLIHLSEEEAYQFQVDFEYLKHKMESPKSSHHKEIMSFLLQSMLLEFYDCIIPRLQIASFSYTSGELLFKRFMDMAVAEMPREREVKHYADQLCITAKYLSVICKQISGKTPSSILNTMTADYIKRMLRATDKSVKQIADEANFSNLSAFGKFVRRELGMSPREYRQKLIE